MEEKGQQSREDRRKGTERRESNIPNYELLNLDSSDKRNEPNRRRVKEKKIK